MRLLFVTDGRSPISRNWIRYFADRGDEVFIASTFQCDVGFPVHGIEFTPAAFSTFKKRFTRLRNDSARTLGLRTRLRQWFGPLTIIRAADKLRSFIREVKPDLVHAMRIPYEGMLAAEANYGFPLVVSVWGNDFTLHAPSTPLMGYFTRKVMQRADALHTDCARDLRLAREWGFRQEKASIIAPGNGGIKSDLFYPPPVPVGDPVIINPRGFRAYVHNTSFFHSIPLVLKRRPDAKFLCTSMEGEHQANRWMKELQIEHAVRLLPAVAHSQMGDIFRRAQILVSPTTHDGTPNSLLEGLACGCFPIAGDIESIREWITHAQNGLLVDAQDPRSLADGIQVAMEAADLRQKAASLNVKLIADRAEYHNTMLRVSEFYDSVK